MAKTRERSGLDLKTIVLIILAGLFILSFIGYMYYSRAYGKAKKALDEEQTSTKSLKNRADEFEDSVATLEKIKLNLEQEVRDLEEVRDKFQAQKDSVERLLAYSRRNEGNSKAKIARLEAAFADLQSKYDSVSRKYQELMDGSGSSIAQLQAQIENLTQERNNLMKENNELKADIIKVTGNADNRTALFTTSFKAIPGRIQRGKFRDQARARKTDVIQTNFNLSRPPKPTENLDIKLFDAANKEIPLKPSYRNELTNASDPTKQSIKLEAESYKFVRGPYSVRVYMTDVEKGVEQNEIGIAEFSLK